MRDMDRREFLRITGLAAAGLGLPDFLRKIPETWLPSVVTAEQRKRLYEASLQYLAKDTEAAIKIAQAIDFKEGTDYDHPAQMCGPLAIVMLQAAGLIDKSVKPHDFLTWDPDKNPIPKKILEKNGYTRYRVRQSVGLVDVSKLKLEAGDFLYMYGGTYEHMLVVTRVDAQGRAYAVTNYIDHIDRDKQGKSTPQFAIQELMLYDPTKPGTGWFAIWSDVKQNQHGRTGTSGFDVWRKTSQPTAIQENSTLVETKQEVEGHNGDKETLGKEITEILNASNGSWGVQFKEVGKTEPIFSLHAEEKHHPASTIKVVIAALFFKWMEENKIDQAKQMQKGTSYDSTHRTFMQLLTAMLVYSEEVATASITNFILNQRNFDVEKTLKSWGMSQTTIAKRSSTAQNLGTVLEGIYTNTFISKASSETILTLMKQNTEGDDRRLGVMKALLPKGAEIANKRGTITQEMLIIGDIGLVILPARSAQEPKKVYTVVFLGYQGQQGKATDTSLVNGLEASCKKVAEYIVKQQTSGKPSA